MEQKLRCAVVKDLLPNYIEKLTSDETNRDIEEHLSNCEPCTKVFDEMKEEVSKSEIPKEDILEEAKDLSRFLRKTKVISALKFSLMMLYILGIVTTVIVDFAINHRITWSMIVIASVIYAMCITSIIMWGNRNRGVIALAFSCIFAIPLLYVISVYCTTCGIDGSLIIRLSRRICLIWVAVIWIAVFVYKVMKQNLWVSLGVMLVLAVFANLLTNAIANQVSVTEQMKSIDTMINGVAYIVSAIASFVVGYKRRGKKI